MSLSEHSPTERFSQAAKDYDSTRPGYPAALLQALLEGFERTHATLAVDVGAGTGISSRFLAGGGIRVIAVEPNDDMRKLGMDSNVPEIRFVKGTAQATRLNSETAHLVTAFQAFHWFEYQSALEEFCRILRPHGRVALVWNVRDPRDHFTQTFTKILDRYADPEIIGELRQKHESGDGLLRSSLFVNGRKLYFPLRQTLNSEEVAARLNTVTYLPRSGPDHENMVKEMATAFARHAKSGVVELVYETIALIGERK
jgi:ubiquinone/menaquinone biosynthesis C-methylase UbiE